MASENADDGRINEFVRLCEDKRSALLRMAGKYLPRGSSRDAEDVLNTALLKIWCHLSKWRRECSLQTFVCREIINTAIREPYPADALNHVSDGLIPDRCRQEPIEKRISNEQCLAMLYLKMPKGHREVLSLWSTDTLPAARRKINYNRAMRYARQRAWEMGMIAESYQKRRTPAV